MDDLDLFSGFCVICKVVEYFREQDSAFEGIRRHVKEHQHPLLEYDRGGSHQPARVSSRPHFEQDAAYYQLKEGRL